MQVKERLVAYLHMLAAQFCTIKFEVIPYKIHYFKTQQLTTGFGKQGQMFHVNIFYSSSSNSFSKMMNTYLATQLQTQMVVQQKLNEFNIKNASKGDVPKLLKQNGLVLIWITNSSTAINVQKGIYERLHKIKIMLHSTKKLSDLYTKEHKQNTKT